jgi:rhamnosyltransferase
MKEKNYELALPCCAIIVSYNTTDHIFKAVDSLITQFSHIVVIDNGSHISSISILQGLETLPTINVIYNESNLGIACALNQGVRYAEEIGCEWVGTFDQDSLVSPSYLKTMMDAYNDCDNNHDVAIISPQYLTKTGLISFSKFHENDSAIKYRQVDTTMTSGNLLKISILKSVGWFDESLFIDYVDHEICLRFRIHSFRIIESCFSILQHELGDSVSYTIVGLKIVTTNHSSIRRYYKYRNMVRILTKYVTFEPKILSPMLTALLTEPLKILLWEDNKRTKIFSIFKGIFHGFMHISGKLPGSK